MIESFSKIPLRLLIKPFELVINKINIYRWKRNLNLSQHLRVFQSLYHPINGFRLSKISRAKKDACEYVYGEIEFVTFIALIGMTAPHAKTKFYDLGSGTGKAVLAAAMVYPMAHYCGIELFENLHQAAVQQKEKLAKMTAYAEASEKVQFIHADLLTVDFSQATLIYINSTAFFGAMWEAMNEKLAQLQPGAWVVTMSKKLISPAFEVKHCTQVEMSWGVATAYLHCRLS